MNENTKYDWSNIRVFLNGVEMTGIKSTTYTIHKKKAAAISKRLRTIAEIVCRKSNLN